MSDAIKSRKGQFGWHIFPPRSQASLLTCLQAAGISANALNFLTHCKYVALLQECFACLSCGKKHAVKFLSLVPPPRPHTTSHHTTVAGDETCWAAGCSSTFRSSTCLTSSSVNSQNLNKNRCACRSAGAALKLQVSLFKTRLPSNISTLQLRRCALFPLSHRPEGCLHITRTTLVKLMNVLGAH